MIQIHTGGSQEHAQVVKRFTSQFSVVDFYGWSCVAIYHNHV